MKKYRIPRIAGDAFRSGKTWLTNTGCHAIPPNIPVESALYYNEVYEELCWR